MITRRVPSLISSCIRCSRIASAQQSMCLFQYKSYSTSNTSTPQEPESSRPIDLRSQFSSSNTPPPPKPKRNLRPYIYGVAFFLVGWTAGHYVRLAVSPPPLPIPGCKEDTTMINYITKTAEGLPIVKSLMEDPAWKYNEAYEGLPSEAKPHRLTTGPLGGARGIGAFQRAFHNTDTGECIIVVWIGGAVAGWPGVVHGGLTATIMDEALGRVAILQFPSRTGVTANLELKYLKPIVTNSFYIIRTAPQKEGATDRKLFVGGTLETLDGKVCLEAKGLFVVPKKFKTKPLSDF